MEKTSFSLDQKLKKDLVLVGDLKLCKLMLLPDASNPWVVLVPQVNGTREIFELEQKAQHLLMDEISLVSLFVQKEFSPDKINVGALGNMVAQLHVHIICRYKNDRAWPGSIWGTSRKIDQSDIKSKITILQKIFN